MLIFPSGYYLKENENVHCSITVRTAYSQHSSVLSTLHPSKHNNTTNAFHVEAPSELLELQHSASIAHNNLGADSKRGLKTWALKGRDLATSLLGQAFCEGT